MAQSPLNTKVTPGSGTITGAEGNAHAITAAGIAQVNGLNAKHADGSPVNFLTSMLFYHPQDVYAQDSNKQWHHFDYAKMAYVTPGNPPGY